MKPEYQLTVGTLSDKETLLNSLLNSGYIVSVEGKGPWTVYIYGTKSALAAKQFLDKIKEQDQPKKPFTSPTVAPLPHKEPPYTIGTPWPPYTTWTGDKTFPFDGAVITWNGTSDNTLEVWNQFVDDISKLIDKGKKG